MKKLVVRADDLGLSDGINCGIRRAILGGAVTACGLMANMPAAEEGYRMVKDLCSCIGMHGNISAGKPLSDPHDIPTLTDENGMFYSSKEIMKRADSISVEECVHELEAQLDRFTEIAGHKPAYFEGHAVFCRAWFDAQKLFAEKHGLFLDMPGFDPAWEKETGIGSLGFIPPDKNGLYDPKKLMEDGLANLDRYKACIGVFHPGYLDQYVLDHSSYTVIRPMECDFLCGSWFRDFVSSHGIQLISMQEAAAVNR